MIPPSSDVIVVGAGVSGLTTAICLADAVRSVRVWTADEVVRTTSYAAGAIYAPYLIEDERAAAWAEETFQDLAKLALDPAGTGVDMVHGWEISRTPVDPPVWARAVPDFRECGPAELPAGFVGGWCYTVPLIDMPVYLGYLRDQLHRLGGVIEQRSISTLAEAAAEASIVVNCTGMGARDLVPDPLLSPVRGELVVVPNPGIDTFLAEHSQNERELTYVLPHRDFVVLGGSADDQRWDREPDEEVAKGILARCTEVQPALEGLPILDHRVGIRPARNPVRVELERNADGVAVLHNYGHGGAGVSISWGCAREVRRLLTG